MPIDSPFDGLIGIRSPFGVRGDSAPLIITATTAPSFGPLTGGDTVQSALSAGALDAANYASTEGTISTVVATVTINGTTGALSDTVSFNDVVNVSILVTDSVGNTRTFGAGTQTVQGIAPTITASDSLSGRTLTITVDSTTGVPAPTNTLTTLTLDGADVLGDETGTGPWTYDVPDNGNDRTVAWEVTASNAEGTATASGSEVISAFDADAAAYISAVETADGQTLEAAVKTAIDDFFVGVKADGNFNALKATHILAGARTISGALVPLVSTMPTPTNNGPFVSADYNRKTGLKGDGSTKYLNTNRANNADPQNSNHNATYLSELSTVACCTMGAGGIADGANNLIDNANSNEFFSRNRNSTGGGTTLGNRVSGFLGANRSVAGSYLHQEPTSSTTDVKTSQPPGSQNLFVFGRSATDGTILELPSDARISFYSIGESLDLPALKTRVEQLITDLDGAIA